MDNARTTHTGKPLPNVKCPTCGYEMDCATLLRGDKSARPRPGDISLCIKCADVLEFQSDFTVKLANLSTLLKLSRRQQFEISQAQSLIRKVK